jgi:uroporphyrinogen decarboxylase
VTKPVVRVLQGERQSVPPIWLMRQAGRYLPEYQVIRRKTDSFLDLCFTPKLATEVTLQPIRRFPLDAAIIFSDILVIPHALGQRVSFEQAEGPRLEPLNDAAALRKLGREVDQALLAPVYETIERVVKKLPAGVALLGFCGAPWTLATYMIAGMGTSDQRLAREFAYRYPDAFAALIDRLVEASAAYLIRQFEAGIDAAQIFDTWAGVLPPDEFESYCIKPCAGIVAKVRKRILDAKIIGFPRGAGTRLKKYVAAVPVNAVGLDWMIDFDFARCEIQRKRPIQGNLDPLALLVGGKTLDAATDRIMESFASGPLIFNLGHGVLPDTPIAHIERLIARVRSSG